MSETEIIKLLARENVDAHFPRLQPQTTKLISKTIVDILHSTSSTNLSDKATRHDILVLLQKWCCTGTKNHSKITIDNYDCYLNCLSVQSDKQGETAPEPVAASVLQYFHTVDDLNTEKQQRIDAIQLYDAAKLGNTTFGIRKDVKVPYNLQDILRTEVPEPLESASDSTSSNTRIKYVLALLNLNDVGEKYLVNAINEMGECDRLNNCEAECIEHVWKNAAMYNLSTGVILALLRKFRFLYEKPLIQTCTELMSGGANVVRLEEALRNVAMKDPQLRHSIISLLYELYACSGYNKKMHPIFKLLDV